jgi:hypothetical protein
MGTVLAPLRQALSALPAHVLGVDTVVEGYLSQQLDALVNELWKSHEEAVLAAIRQRVTDAIYGGAWA